MFSLFPPEDKLPKCENLMIFYEVNLNEGNHEWRECVQQFIEKVGNLGYLVSPIEIPEFYPSEDFVDLIYRFNTILVKFNSDSIVNTIYVTADSDEAFLPIWHQIGKTVGWALPYTNYEKKWWQFWK